MKDIAYFDNAATTWPKPEEVYVFMDKFYRNYGANVGRGQHKMADKATALVNETRAILLDLFHCPQKQVVFSHSATESLNLILQGIKIFDGMNIYISPFEHNAVTRILNHLKDRYNLNIIELSVKRNGLVYDLEIIKQQFQENKPHIVVVSHASNVCGLIAPIKEIFDYAKLYDAITITDLAQTAGLIDLNLTEVKADFAVFAGHKTLYSSFGIGGFISNKYINIKPLTYGGTGYDSANQNMPEQIPEKFEVGSIDIRAISSLNASIKWINRIGIDNIKKRENENLEKLIAALMKYDKFKILSQNTSDNVGIVSCTYEDYSPDDIGKILSKNSIAVRTGLHCAPSAHKFLGTYPAGTIRFSVSYFNDEDDFEILENCLEYLEMNS